METEDRVVLKTKDKKIYDSYNSDFTIPNKVLYSLIAIIIFLILIINIFYFNNSKNNLNGNNFFGIGNSIREIDDMQIFDKSTLYKLQQEQIEFCNNPQNNYIKEYENQIALANISLLSQSFKMYVYKENDIISKELLYSESWEGDQTNNLLTALLFYSAIYNLKPQDIYFIDIGSNVGWYSIFVAKYGYNVISFDPSEINNYILKKNYCINRELNITFIKKGLYTDEGKCDYYINNTNVGEGSIFCDKSQNNIQHLEKNGEVMVTKLSNYIPFLLQNNLALIRIDVEGSEAQALEGGIKLITKNRIPYIFMKFNPRSLMAHGTEPRKFLKMFLKNGYRFASYNFFDNDFLSIDEIIGKSYDGYINLYIVHSKMTKKYYRSSM